MYCYPSLFVIDKVRWSGSSKPHMLLIKQSIAPFSCADGNVSLSHILYQRRGLCKKKKKKTNFLSCLFFGLLEIQIRDILHIWLTLLFYVSWGGGVTCTEHLNFKLTSNSKSDLMMFPVWLDLTELSICSQALKADFSTIFLASLLEL